MQGGILSTILGVSLLVFVLSSMLAMGLSPTVPQNLGTASVGPADVRCPGRQSSPYR